MRLATSFALLWLFPNLGLAQGIAIGDWQIHLPYNNVLQVAEAGDRIYAATGSAVYYFDKTDNSLTRMSKVSGLSDVAVSSIGYQASGDVLVIAYNNANIDIVKSGLVYNVSDIKRKNILGDKSINSITINGGYAYLSTGFGIVTLDLSKNEIKDTYTISVNQDAVNQVVMLNDTIYAATDKGLFKAPFSGSNLSDFNSWILVTELPVALYSSIAVLNGKLFLVEKSNPLDTSTTDLMFEKSSGSAWVGFATGVTEVIHSIQASANRVLISVNGKVYVYDENGLLINTYANPVDPRHAIYDKDGNIWIADYYAGLIKNNASWGIYPRGPSSDKAFDMAFGKDELWVAAGGRTGDWNSTYSTDGIFNYINNNWNSTPSELLGNIRDFVRIAVDPSDKDRSFAGSWGFGVAEIYKGELVTLYNEGNTDSSLQSIVANDNFIRIGGLDFDDLGNLWVTSTGVDNSLCVRRANGNWLSYQFQGIGTNSRVSEVLVDQQGYKWILLDKAGILVFDDNKTLGNTNDDQNKRLINAVGSGNISLDVLSIAEDLDGEIWVGTNEGMYVFYSPSLVFSNEDYDAQQILVDQGGFFQYLLEAEAVTAIAIDGANRKWLGTENAGVFLMSEDGTVELEHFTDDNSPLLSNTITTIAINQESGEAFFGTNKGIISYKGTATEGAVTHTDVYAYPNPVREDYAGTIAIKGLVTDADVKITNISGELIFETKALGGQAIWDGKNFSGDKAHTGIYLVFATDELGTETVVTKIMLIN